MYSNNGYFFCLSPVISHFIHLLLSMWFLLLVSTLHTLVVATSDKPRTSFAVVKNNLLLTEYAWNLNTLRKSPIVNIIFKGLQDSTFIMSMSGARRLAVLCRSPILFPYAVSQNVERAMILSKLLTRRRLVPSILGLGVYENCILYSNIKSSSMG